MSAEVFRFKRIDMGRQIQKILCDVFLSRKFADKKKRKQSKSQFLAKKSGYTCLVHEH